MRVAGGMRWLVVGALLALLVGCSDSAPETPLDGSTPRRDTGVTFPDGSADLRTIPDGDDTCQGVGCPCENDTPCIEGDDQTICGSEGICVYGCNANVPCTGDEENCCDNECIEGCCDSSDCPGGKVCDEVTHSCGSCENHDECGTDGRCCGETGDKSCVLGNCCEPADCTEEDETCIDHLCLVTCDTNNPCSEGVCCKGGCFDGDCCGNADCSGGQACVDNTCGPCTLHEQCGSNEICNAQGACVVGCNGTVTCGNESVCCGDSGFCAPADSSCEGTCRVGNCCSKADCLPSEECAPDGYCRVECGTGCGAGKVCCGGFCHDQPCVDTLAGSGLGGAPDAPIAQAYINGVYDLVADGAGNVLFTEWASSGVRVVNNGASAIGPVAAGRVGRLTGGRHGCKPGPVAEAEMRLPIGLTRDNDGNIYVADYNCYVIWKISSDYTTVSLLAGKPGARGVVDGTGEDARFNNPRGITFGPDSRLYVSDYTGYVIRQVTLTGVVKTVAGKAGERGEVDGDATTVARLDNPSGLVMDAGGTLFVGDYDSGAVRKIDGLTSGNAQVSTIIPTTVDPDPDPRRRWIRKYGGAAHGGMSVAAGQKVYINFWNAGTHMLTPPASGTEWDATSLATGSYFIVNDLDPADADVLWLGSWVHGGTTSNSNTIQKYDLSGSTVTQTIGQPGLVKVADGASDEATFATGRCDGAITVDASGNVWVADRCAARVRKITPGGAVTSFGTGQYAEAAGGATTAKFRYPTAILAVGNDIYVASLSGGRISKISSAGEVTLLGNTCVSSEEGIGENNNNLCPRPSPVGGMVVDANDNLYITVYNEPGAGRSDTYGKSYWDGMPMIVKVSNLGSGTPSFFAGTRNNPADPDKRNTCVDGPLGTGQFGTWPYGLAIDSGGYLYVGDGACGVRKVAPDGYISTLNNSFGAVGVAIGDGPDGAETLFVSRGNQIWTVNRLTGAAEAYAGLGSWSWDRHHLDGALRTSLFWGPHSLATGPDGELYVLDRYNNQVRVIRTP